MDRDINLQTGQIYHSKRTGKQLTITAIEGEYVYYVVEGFDTIAPLFLPRDKFIHLVGLDEKT